MSVKETITQIVETIDSCEKARNGMRPIARVHCLYGDKVENLWFLPDSSRSISDHKKEMLRYGKFVPKNSYPAIELMKRNAGSSFEHLNYRIELINRTDLQNKTISLAGDPILYQYRNLTDFLRARHKLIVVCDSDFMEKCPGETVSRKSYGIIQNILKARWVMM